MPKIKSKIRIFWLENGIEKHKTIKVNPPEMKWENSFDLYNYGLTEVCHYFNCLVPEDLYQEVRWCYDWLPYSDIDPDLTWDEKKKIYETDEYQQWLTMKIETWCCEATDSMYSDAYKYLLEACKYHNNGEDVDETDIRPKRTQRTHLVEDSIWKDPFWINYLINEYIGNQKSYVPTGAWIFRDGSYLTVDSGNHRRIVEEYMNLKEQDVEKSWIKIQLYWAYTHKWMTSAQEKTLNKLFKKYPDDLHESNVLWEKYGKDW